MSFAILIPCGPAEMEKERMEDLLDAIAHFEPGCDLVLILDDGNARLRDLELPRGSVPVEILPHPRRNEGWGWAGGLVYGELSGLAHIHARRPDVAFVVKFDTDALPVAPFSAALSQIFEDKTLGMVGSRIIDEQMPAYKQTAPLSYFRNKIDKMLAPLSLWRKPTWHLRVPFFDARLRRIASILRTAIARGYTKGELIEGGALAWSGAFVRGLVKSGVHLEREVLLRLNVSDDLFLTPLAYFLGLRCADSELFCIEPNTLRHTLEEMLKLDGSVAIVHSLKGQSPDDERRARAAFRERRRVMAVRSSV